MKPELADVMKRFSLVLFSFPYVLNPSKMLMAADLLAHLYCLSIFVFNMTWWHRGFMERSILMKRMTQLITNRPPPPHYYVSYILLLLHVLKQTGNETTESICHDCRRTRARCIHDESAEKQRETRMKMNQRAAAWPPARHWVGEFDESPRTHKYDRDRGG